MRNSISAWIDGRAAFEGVGAPLPGAGLVDFDGERAGAASVYDLAVQRGDGIFEATSVWQGHPLSLIPHLARLQHSAGMLDLPRIKTDVLVEAVGQVIAAYRERFAPGPDDEQMLKILVSRGSDPQLTGGAQLDPGVPHVWVIVDHRVDDPRHPVPQTLVKLPKGVSVDAPDQVPWMLWGAKTLSYAMNKAAYRECARRGANNAIFYSTEGIMLECPTSSLVFRLGDRFFTPVPTLGILYGTSQRELFSFLRGQGYECSYGRYPVDILDTADAIWTMGGSNVHPVTHLDGREIRYDEELAVAANLNAREHRDEVTAASMDEWGTVVR